MHHLKKKEVIYTAIGPNSCANRLVRSAMRGEHSCGTYTEIHKFQNQFGHIYDLKRIGEFNE